MTRSRQDYIQRRIDLALQRQRHAREAQPGCGCPFCIKDGQVLATIRKRIEARAQEIGEAPF